MEDRRAKEIQARTNGSIVVYRLIDDLVYTVKKQLDDIIEDHIIEYTDHPIFELRNYLLNKMKTTDEDYRIHVKLIPMFSPTVDELRRDFAALIHKKEYPKSDKAQSKIEEMFNKFQNMNMVPKYKVEFHDKNGKIGE